MSDGEAVDVAWLKPARQMRRDLAGKACQMCALPLHHSSIFLVQVTQGKSTNSPAPVHEACLQMIIEQVKAVNEAPGAADGGGTSATPAE